MPPRRTPCQATEAGSTSDAFASLEPLGQFDELVRRYPGCSTMPPSCMIPSAILVD